MIEHLGICFVQDLKNQQNENKIKKYYKKGNNKNQDKNHKDFLNALNFNVFMAVKFLAIAMLLFTFVFVSSFSIDSVNAANITIQNTNDTIIKETIDNPIQFTEIYLNEGNYFVDEQIIINRFVAIIGNTSDKSKVVIDGKGETSIFNIVSTGNLNLINITFTNCFANNTNGGAIFNDGGNLSIINCAFENNSADGSGGAIYSINGIINIKDSTFIGNNASFGGGAIENYALDSVYIEKCIFENNSAVTRGGAINNDNVYGTLNIINCNFINNFVIGLYDIFVFGDNGEYAIFDPIDGYGGAIYNDNSGGGVNIINSNFTDNWAYFGGGAIYNIYSTMIVRSSNFNGNEVKFDSAEYSDETYPRDPDFCLNRNGGSIYNNHASLVVYGSNFTDNWAYFGGAIDNQNGTLNITLCNFINNGAGFGGAIQNWVYEAGFLSLYEVIIENIIILDSKFINNVAKYDGGAIFNYIANDTYIRNCSFENNIAYGLGGAIVNRYTKESLTIINSIFNNNTALYNGEYYSNYLSSENNDLAPSGWGGAIANFNSNVGIILNNSIFTNNSADYGGGAIYNYNSTFYMNNCNFTSNFVKYIPDNSNEDTDEWDWGNGGAIDNHGSDLYIYRCNFIFNNASCGGAIFNNKGHIVIDFSYFAYNSAINGGAIYSINKANLIDDAVATRYVLITNSKFEKNNASRHGGAIAKYDAEIQIFASEFISNRAEDAAGAIYNSGKNQLTITKSNFYHNSAFQYAGAIYNLNGNVVISSSNFDKNWVRGNNSTQSQGGAIHNQHGDTHILNSSFIDNSALYSGGAISATENSTIEIIGSYFYNNVASRGNGGAFYCSNASFVVEGCQFIHNRALNGLGGVIYSNTNQNFQIEYCLFNDNRDILNYTIYNANNNYKITANHSWWGSNQVPKTLNYNVDVNNYYTIILTSNITGKNINTFQSITYNYYFVLNGTYNKGNVNRFPYYEFEIALPNGFVQKFDCRFNQVFYHTSNIAGDLVATATLNKAVQSLKHTVVKQTPSIVITKVTSTYNNVVKLKATLKDQFGNPIANKYVHFYVKGNHIGYAITNSLGVATLKYTPKNIGNYKVITSFSGDSGYNAKSSNYNMKVAKAKTKISIKISKSSGKFNKQGLFRVTIRDKSKKAIAKRLIHFYINGKDMGKALTNKKGIATFEPLIKIKGTVSINAIFMGNEIYHKSSKSKKLNIR